MTSIFGLGVLEYLFVGTDCCGAKIKRERASRVLEVGGIQILFSLFQVAKT